MAIGHWPGQGGLNVAVMADVYNFAGFGSKVWKVTWLLLRSGPICKLCVSFLFGRLATLFHRMVPKRRFVYQFTNGSGKMVSIYTFSGQVSIAFKDWL